MQTIGERLEEARKKKGVSIREAAEATKIRGDYLQKFESNQFDIGLTEIYTRGFLRTYGAFLKLPVDRIMSDYAALGRGDIRPRQPNREVYGRMDISVASSSDTGERAAPPEETAPTPEPAAARPQPHYPRSAGSSMPSGPDPAVLFKWIKLTGIFVALVLIVWIVKSLFSGSSKPTPRVAATSAAVSPSAQPTITLVATNPVHVKVQRKNPDDTYGDVLFEGTLNRGDTRVIPRPGALYISATACENVQIEINGRRYGMGLTGVNTGMLPAP
ncbi:MAG TPA: helix-turn-helix domain-containing protein [Opitutaceae bacterium]|nr:helix-turn-helix domain-containing protein [Opitutaceae bacterium]